MHRTVINRLNTLACSPVEMGMWQSPVHGSGDAHYPDEMLVLRQGMGVVFALMV